MERHILWTPWVDPGLEHLHLTSSPDGIVADSLVVALHEGEPFRARYRVHCDPAWRTLAVDVALLDSPRPPLTLRHDGAGHWATPDGAPIPALDGCLDPDIALTPFTNTLPIRRLGLPIGATRDLTMAYIRVPELTVVPDPQRYTRLAARRFRYESRDSDFVAELPLDADGLVLDYPGLFRRAWPR